MFPTEAVAMILSMMIFFGAIWAVTNTVLSHRRKMEEIRQGTKALPAHDPEKVELKETVAMLQDRLAVLESIATDPARRTADEIENLR